MSSRGFYQTNGAFGPMARRNQTVARFTQPLNPGAHLAFRPQVGRAAPTTQTIAGNPAKSCCSDCAKDGRNR
jgi:hypothetical protein